MRSVVRYSLLVTVLFLALSNSGPSLSSAPKPVVATPISVPPAPTPAPVTLTSATEGGIVIVTSTADSGPGTLRQALANARSGDTITFDPTVFPPGAPVTIFLTDKRARRHQCSVGLDLPERL